MTLMRTWIYSRNQRRHTLISGDGEDLFWICSNTPYGGVQRRHHGYTLSRPEGVPLKTGKSVKRLKQAAEEMTQAIRQ